MVSKNAKLYFESSKKLEELRAKREPLFQRLATNPNEFHLAIEIKFIDDQIADLNCIMQEQR